MTKIITTTEKKPITTLFELLEKYEVEIPIIQRDYAQGRTDADTALVRSTLLKDMRAAIKSKTPPLDISFVYGKAENGKFIPVDGQQRLTTLFLLHLYAFRNDDTKTELFNKFTYETRTTSSRFIKKLIENRSTVFKAKTPPSYEIKDSEWFVSSWINDPTIQSVFVMLDAIKKHFNKKKVKSLRERLTDDEHKPINFKFLDMNDLGMEDDLYLKLNARGRPLTPFENFKARLIKSLGTILPDLRHEFEQNFDISWSNFFWEHHETSYDDAYLAFFGILLMNKGKIDSDENWSSAFKFERIDETTFMTVYHTLNYLDSAPESETYKQARALIFDALSGEGRTYTQRVLFHAVTTYLYESQGSDDGSLWQWLRVFRNLALNTRIDGAERYRSAIAAINNSAENFESILEHLEQRGTIAFFARGQLREEQDKARIITQDADFAEEIYKAEKHGYFRGQIRCALIPAMENGNDLDTFKSYWNKISALFDDSKPLYGNDMRRALLTFGDYTLWGEDKIYRSLCVNTHNVVSRSPTMKRLFSGDDKTEYEYVREFLDRISSDGSSDAKEQLENIIAESEVPQYDWRYCFIHYPNLFGEMSESHLRMRDVKPDDSDQQQWILIPKVASHGANLDLYLTALREALNAEFDIQSHHSDNLGRGADRYLTVGDFKVRFEGGSYMIQDNDGNLVLETSSETPISEALDYFKS